MRNLGSSARRLYTAGLMDGSLHLPLHWEQAFGTPDDNKLRRRKHPAPSESDHAQDFEASGGAWTGDSVRFWPTAKGSAGAQERCGCASGRVGAARRRGTKAGHGTAAGRQPTAGRTSAIFQVRIGQISDTGALGAAF